MKAAVMYLLLLIVAYAESQDGVAVRPSSIPLPGLLPLPRRCALGFNSVPVNANHCSGYVEIGFCSGTCYSTAEYNIELHKTQYTCTCCKATTMAPRTAYLTCAGRQQMAYTYSTIASCACLNCESIPIPA